jgi:hypothetical protein
VVPPEPRFPERLILAVLRAPDIFRNEVPQLLGILGFALAAFSDMPDWARTLCGVIGAGALALYLLSSPSSRVRLADRLAARLRQVANDVHLTVRAEAGDERLLQQYLRETYGSWYFADLPSALVRLNKPTHQIERK